jgi:hypothetical protein
MALISESSEFQLCFIYLLWLGCLILFILTIYHTFSWIKFEQSSKNKNSASNSNSPTTMINQIRFLNNILTIIAIIGFLIQSLMQAIEFNFILIDDCHLFVSSAVIFYYIANTSKNCIYLLRLYSVFVNNAAYAYQFRYILAMIIFWIVYGLTAYVCIFKFATFNKVRVEIVETQQIIQFCAVDSQAMITINMCYALTDMIHSFVIAYLFLKPVFKLIQIYSQSQTKAKTNQSNQKKLQC